MRKTAPRLTAILTKFACPPPFTIPCSVFIRNRTLSSIGQKARRTAGSLSHSADRGPGMFHSRGAVRCKCRGPHRRKYGGPPTHCPRCKTQAWGECEDPRSDQHACPISLKFDLAPDFFWVKFLVPW
jgi:hypothetical protein